jgi:hypothetical protein
VNFDNASAEQSSTGAIHSGDFVRVLHWVTRGELAGDDQ